MTKKTGIFTALILLVILAVLGAVYFLYFQKDEETTDALTLKPADFSDLSGWQQDSLEQFLPSFLQSCTRIQRYPDDRSMGGNLIAGRAVDWKDLCQKAFALPSEATTIRRFLETNFTPFEVRNNVDPVGLFTGYYEASLKGSLTQSEIYNTPLYLRPAELVMVHLGRFRDSLKGQRIAGQVKNGELLPYPTRKDIESGALENRDLEIVWVDSAVDAFFLHIQGSGRIELEEGGDLRVGYAAQNGHPYFAIGKTLIEEGHVPREKMSMQAIRQWLEENPERAQEVMNKNASYIFFRKLDTSAPIGAQGVPLTPKRSLAVDRKWMPLGVPVWLETEVEGSSSAMDPFNHLLMAQDTGGAIRGPVRGDVFWGHGSDAYEKAGSMKSTGRYWIFLPNKVAKEYLEKSSAVPTG
ncbi:murein transglycosylase A [Sneathiella aquimaris]|uniref:murein transglycosylase A n=1 Tax=Sneathiella aquimaris TaxID=2599305 RepID=UPI00146C6485|nr:MltA domain-containing protein [Sneathiella aquimaris]